MAEPKEWRARQCGRLHTFSQRIGALPAEGEGRPHLGVDTPGDDALGMQWLGTPSLEASPGADPEALLRRTRTLQEVFSGSSWLSAEQINALQARPPRKKSDPARAWERRGRIFGVSIGGKRYFPAYQFDALSHRPLPIIQEILKALGPVDDAWAVAVWFHFPNGWIGRRRHDREEKESIAPKDALNLRDAVLKAAANRRGTYVA